MKISHKKNLSLLIGLAITGVTPAFAAVDFIEQVDLESGMVYQVYVDGPEEPGSKNGEQVSPMPVGNKGSTFALYAKGLDPDDTIYLLDEKYVAAYTPEAVITITSEDPHPTPRTRADEPFTVNVKIDGLLAPGADVPEAALNVYLQQVSLDYDELLDRAPTDGTAQEVVDSLRAYYRTQETRPVPFRRDRLRALSRAIEAPESEDYSAMEQFFRSAAVSRVQTDVFGVLEDHLEIEDNRRVYY